MAKKLEETKRLKPFLGRRFRTARIQDDDNVVSMFVNRGFVRVQNVNDEVDFVVWTGGADISPFLYGQAQHRTTKPFLLRDLMEVRAYRTHPIDLPKIGICRGAQLLNAMNGGDMFQDINNHVGIQHDVTNLVTGEVTKINSVHHQGMIPTANAEILLIANNVATVKHTDIKTFNISPNTPSVDHECLFYPESNSFCFQAHPEYGHAATTATFFQLLESTFEIAEATS